MTCGNCNGTGQKKVQIFNTITQKWTTLTETCLRCNGTGQLGRR